MLKSLFKQKEPQNGSGRIKNLFLSVGAMKAGTTWLYENMKDHEDIYFTPEKEIHYFANVSGIEKQLNHKSRVEKLKSCLEHYHQGNIKYIAENASVISWYADYARSREISDEWYIDLFRLKGNEKYCADFSNLYCQMEQEGWDHVYSVADNVKVIYTLRDPIKRLWSHYKFHMKWVNREDDSLEAGFEHFKDLLEKPFFWINSEYFDNYKRLQRNVRDGNLKLLYFEDARDEPQDQINEICDFLEVDRFDLDESKAEKQVNKTKEFSAPPEWEDYMREKLAPISKKMKTEGVWHSKWTDC